MLVVGAGGWIWPHNTRVVYSVGVCLVWVWLLASLHWEVLVATPCLHTIFVSCSTLTGQLAGSCEFLRQLSIP